MRCAPPDQTGAVITNNIQTAVAYKRRDILGPRAYG